MRFLQRRVKVRGSVSETPVVFQPRGFGGLRMRTQPKACVALKIDAPSVIPASCLHEFP